MDLSPLKSNIKKRRKKTFKKLSVAQVPQIVISRAISKKFNNNNRVVKSKSRSGSRKSTGRKKKSFIYLKKRGRSNEKEKDQNILLPPLFMQHIGSQVKLPKIQTSKGRRKSKKSARGSASRSKSGKRKKTLAKISVKSNNSFKGLKCGALTPSRIANYITKNNSSSRRIDPSKKGKSISDFKVYPITKRNPRFSKIENSPLYAALPKNLKSQLQSRPQKYGSSKDIKPVAKASSTSEFSSAISKLKASHTPSHKEIKLNKQYHYKASFESPFNKKHDTSQISENEFASFVEAKLNLTSMVQNSKTIEDMVKTPRNGSYLQCSASKDSPMRKKSPKEIKIVQVPEETDLYQETNLVKGRAPNSKNFIVNKIFKKKKNAIKYILKRKENTQNKPIINRLNKPPLTLEEAEDKQNELSKFTFNPKQDQSSALDSQIGYIRVENPDQKEEIKRSPKLLNNDRSSYTNFIEEPQVSNIQFEPCNYINDSCSDSSEKIKDVNLSDLMHSVSSQSREGSPESCFESRAKYDDSPTPVKPNERYRFINPSDESLVVLQESESFQ
ncbi:unnamed protein product [Moneuplotes crassus]|uniref:Uncharacterized protein n=1 Tax=Euplotes crassus TaxID=5936 RepID=A0AAD1X9I9_EUPCR|nr:unnamed protein product [Moneuplotes crassus]